jgi:tetratricopeptide (TPR) repeat protein
MPVKVSLTLFLGIPLGITLAESIDSSLDRAARHLDRGDRESAMQILATLPADAGGEADVWFRTAVFLHQRGLEQDARKYAERAVSARANRADYVFLLGTILVGLKEFSAAASLLEPLSRIEKAPAALDALIGRAYTGTRAYDKAIASFERAIVKQPRDLTFRIELTHVLLRSGSLAAATQQLQLAREIFRFGTGASRAGDCSRGLGGGGTVHRIGREVPVVTSQFAASRKPE